jgi:hypothetical protein
MISAVLNHSLTRAICWYLCIFLVGIHAVPSPAYGSFITSTTDDSNAELKASLQMFLEKELISERLAMLGLSHEEVTSRVANLSDEECRNIVSAFSQLQLGGEEQISERANKSFEGWLENFLGGLAIILEMLVYLVLICVLYEAGFFDESSEPEY